MLLLSVKFTHFVCVCVYVCVHVSVHVCECACVCVHACVRVCLQFSCFYKITGDFLICHLADYLRCFAELHCVFVFMDIMIHSACL